MDHGKTTYTSDQRHDVIQLQDKSTKRYHLLMSKAAPFLCFGYTSRILSLLKWGKYLINFAHCVSGCLSVYISVFVKTKPHYSKHENKAV